MRKKERKRSEKEVRQSDGINGKRLDKTVQRMIRIGFFVYNRIMHIVSVTYEIFGI